MCESARELCDKFASCKYDWYHLCVCVCVCVCVLSCLINLYCGRRKKMLSCHHRIFLLDPVASEHAPEALLVDGRPSNLRVPLLQRYYCVQLC